MKILSLFKRKKTESKIDKRKLWHSGKVLPSSFDGRDIVCVYSEEIGFQSYSELEIIDNPDLLEYIKRYQPFCVWAYKYELAEYISKKYWKL